MASISNDKNGLRRILFVAPGGKRKTIRLGKVSKRVAEGIKFRVEQLLAAKMTGHAIEADTARWVAELDNVLADKLARVGLIESREAKESTLLGGFLDSYIASRTDVKPITVQRLLDSRRYLVAYFGEEKPMLDITAGDADDYRRHLLERLGDNTVRRQCGRAKQFFRAALRKRVLHENPFEDMKGCSVLPNRSRDYYITLEEAGKVLAACPDSQWRLLFALSRFGGLRCPSEHLSLTWADVNWENNRMRVPSPKTEHHAGCESRMIPIFSELRSHLEEAFDQAEPGTEHVITRYRDVNANLRTQLLRIIKRAGLEAWPKLFQNLRATRETELAQTYPIHVVCKWLGNSQAVAAKHYLQVTDEHFEQAAQNAAQSVHVSGCSDSQSESIAQEKTPVLQGLASPCDIVHNRTVPPAGFEPAT